MSKKYHPDKNPYVLRLETAFFRDYLYSTLYTYCLSLPRGNESAHQKFVEVSEAYDALSDSETRRIYDKYGHEGLEQHKRGGGAAHHHDPFDLFSRFFGGGGHFGQGGGQRRGHNLEVTVHLPLRDFYNGRTSDFSVEKQVICEECEGTGSSDGEVDVCSQCGGRGMMIQKHMLAPGIFQQVQSVCNTCGGRGQTIRHPCKVCGGSKVVRKVTTYDIHVEPGMSKGMRIHYENEADQSPDWVAGDLIVVLDEKTPELGGDDDDDDAEQQQRTDGTFFRRKGKDLFWKEVLSLREAWMGDWSRNITHLDGHVVRLGRKRGDVVQPNTVEVIKGEGMPIWEQTPGNNADAKKKNKKFGALHVEYVVVLPDQMDKKIEKDFWVVWEKYRSRKGFVSDLDRDIGRPPPPHQGLSSSSKKAKDEL